jgi:hypothetical protein
MVRLKILVYQPKKCSSSYRSKTQPLTDGLVFIPDAHQKPLAAAKIFVATSRRISVIVNTAAITVTSASSASTTSSAIQRYILEANHTNVHAVVDLLDKML